MIKRGVCDLDSNLPVRCGISVETYLCYLTKQLIFSTPSAGAAAELPLTSEAE